MRRIDLLWLERLKVALLVRLTWVVRILCPLYSSQRDRHYFVKEYENSFLFLSKIHNSVQRKDIDIRPEPNWSYGLRLKCLPRGKASWSCVCLAAGSTVRSGTTNSAFWYNFEVNDIKISENVLQFAKASGLNEARFENDTFVPAPEHFVVKHKKSVLILSDNILQRVLMTFWLICLACAVYPFLTPRSTKIQNESENDFSSKRKIQLHTLLSLLLLCNTWVFRRGPTRSDWPSPRS